MKYIPVFSAAAAVIAAAALANWLWPNVPDAHQGLAQALQLSQVVLIGLGATVALMAALAAVFWALGLSNGNQALGLPEGSVRALISFSLVLIFVCISAFIYNDARNSAFPPGKSLSRVKLEQIGELRTMFAVAYEPSKVGENFVKDSDGSQLYDVTYYSRADKGGDDLGKQIFTTIGTVFVSVISFYFGSSSTSSGVATGATVALTDPLGAGGQRQVASPDVSFPGPRSETKEAEGVQPPVNGNIAGSSLNDPVPKAGSGDRSSA